MIAHEIVGAVVAFFSFVLIASLFSSKAQTSQVITASTDGFTKMAGAITTG